MNYSTMIAPKLDAFDLDLLMKIDRVYFGHAVLEVGLRVEHLVGAYITINRYTQYI